VTLTASILPQQLGGGIINFLTKQVKSTRFLCIFIIMDSTKMKENRFGDKTSRTYRRIEAISIVLRTVKMPLIDEIDIIIRSLSNVKYDV
jgi:hypothetical protein